MKDRRLKQKKRHKGDEAVPLVQHLAELKRMVLTTALIFVFFFTGTFVFSKQLLESLIRLAEGCGYEIMYLTPQEIVMQKFRIAGSGAVLLGAPLMLFGVYRFIRIALNKRERLAGIMTAVFGYGAFWLGAVFAYRVTYPLMLQFFIGVNNEYVAASAVSIEGFISLAFTVFLVFGCITELPVFCVLLAETGVLTVGKMRMAEKTVVVAMFALGALITPPDVISQLLVAVPMIVLYKFSELLVWICEKRKKRLNSGGGKLKNE